MTEDTTTWGSHSKKPRINRGHARPDHAQRDATSPFCQKSDPRLIRARSHRRPDLYAPPPGHEHPKPLCTHISMDEAERIAALAAHPSQFFRRALAPAPEAPAGTPARSRRSARELAAPYPTAQAHLSLTPHHISPTTQRIIAIVLALSFGTLGIHNLFLGHYARAARNILLWAGCVCASALTGNALFLFLPIGLVAYEIVEIARRHGPYSE
ncbi:hypothetical protein [Trueperella sp. LYQ143]|uniref:hypothetical protein n=1 Tax=Trueperella sp. LYQ143 TaxID=3391059 RepID=UPI0039831FD6